MSHLVAVGLGGGVGSILRFALTRLAERTVIAAGLPLGTLIVNVTGCLGVGLLFGWAPWRGNTDHVLHRLLAFGFLGGFTTFSAFGLEAVQLVRQGETWRAVSHIGLHLILGFVAVAVGLICGGQLRGGE
ncbi:MAG: fluoride efflux transporter CrcB [Acidobacteriota bacterium]|nr:fluoride efflux transporter CrcB [Acidobacteriota bacterium]